MYVGRDRVPAERARRGKAEDTGAGAKIKDIAVARARASEPVEHSEASGRGRMLPGAECASGIDQKGNAACGGRAGKIGRAHVCTPVTNAHLVCRLLLEKKK